MGRIQNDLHGHAALGELSQRSRTLMAPASEPDWVPPLSPAYTCSPECWIMGRSFQYFCSLPALKLINLHVDFPSTLLKKMYVPHDGKPGAGTLGQDHMEQERQERPVPHQCAEPPPQTRAGISGREGSQSSEFCGGEPQSLLSPSSLLWVPACPGMGPLSVGQGQTDVLLSLIPPCKLSLLNIKCCS